MNSTKSVSFNNSPTSSETSESHSIDDNKANPRDTALTRARNSWKRMKDLATEKEKENEAKRPPWRAVSVSTLPKPDKNALMRARLLDASRRLRAGKVNVSSQTDFVPTKLMREACHGVQRDLILSNDVGILTDGQVSFKKDGHQQYVLTYSMSQMTDSVDTSEISTQTLLPRIYNEKLGNSLQTDFIDGNFVSDVGKQVDEQIAKLRKFYSKEDTQHEDKPQGIELKPTLTSWHFDDDLIEMDAKQHFIPYTIEPYKPWRSFVPFPFRLSGKSLIGNQRIDWYALLQSIDVLIRESNNLVDKLERVMIEKNAKVIQESQMPITNAPKFEIPKFIPPSQHWLPIIEEQEKQLQNMLLSIE